MDILYLTNQTKEELLKYCEQSLIDYVFNDFSLTGKIINNSDGEKPSRWWIITDYVTTNRIEAGKKFAVILSLAAIAGFVQIGDRCERGDVNVICMFQQLGFISEEDFDYFTEHFFNYSQGKRERFSL